MPCEMAGEGALLPYYACALRQALALLRLLDARPPGDAVERALCAELQRLQEEGAPAQGENEENVPRAANGAAAPPDAGCCAQDEASPGPRLLLAASLVLREEAQGAPLGAPLGASAGRLLLAAAGASAEDKPPAAHHPLTALSALNSRQARAPHLSTDRAPAVVAFRFSKFRETRPRAPAPRNRSWRGCGAPRRTR